MKRTVTLTVEATLYEPEIREDGSRSTTAFLLAAGGTYKVDGQTHAWGMAGPAVVAYLPHDAVIAINIEDIIKAALELQIDDIIKAARELQAAEVAP